MKLKENENIPESKVFILENGKEVKRFVPGISLRFDEQEVFDKIKKEIK